MLAVIKLIGDLIAKLGIIFKSKFNRKEETAPRNKMSPSNGEFPNNGR